MTHGAPTRRPVVFFARSANRQTAPLLQASGLAGDSQPPGRPAKRRPIPPPRPQPEPLPPTARTAGRAGYWRPLEQSFPVASLLKSAAQCVSVQLDTFATATVQAAGSAGGRSVEQPSPRSVHRRSWRLSYSQRRRPSKVTGSQPPNDSRCRDRGDSVCRHDRRKKF
jgi:hypothetical protein